MISVDKRKLITSLLSFLTNAPITPRLVNRKYSNGRVLLVVFKNGYKNKGICATSSDHTRIPFRNNPLVSVWEATHCKSASALQTRLLAPLLNPVVSNGYTPIISWIRAAKLEFLWFYQTWFQRNARGSVLDPDMLLVFYLTLARRALGLLMWGRVGVGRPGGLIED